MQPPGKTSPDLESVSPPPVIPCSLPVNADHNAWITALNQTRDILRGKRQTATR